MISAYLEQLFANCPVLKKTPGFDRNACLLGFRRELSETAASLGLYDEHGLITWLKGRRPADLGSISQSHPFLAIFYLVNSLDEQGAGKSDFDALGRFRHECSAWHTAKLPANHVLDLMRSSVKRYEFLGRSYVYQAKRSQFFLSHDIDSIYGSLVQDGLWAARHLRIDVIMKLVASEVLRRPGWFNIDRIMALESEYDFRSTFYWLVTRGRIDARQTNADYNIHSRSVTRSVKTTATGGFEAGLHKSISAETLAQEIKKMPVPVRGNRYHYLKFRLPEAYRDIEAAGLELDASLGFAEQYGFRNCYSFPFSPYEMERSTTHSFLEVPLTIMDGTLQRYLRVPVAETAGRVIGFLENHRQDALISILWHNTFFTPYKYKGYVDEYKKILAYLHGQKFECLNQSDIIASYSWKRP